MDIAMLKAMTVTKSAQPSTKTVDKSLDQKAFSNVFQSAVATSKEPAKKAVEETTVIEDVSAVLEQDSVQGMLEELGIETDESGLFAFIGEAQIPVAVEELLTLENLTELLGITEEQLTAIVEQLIGEEVELTDVWSMIEQAPAILAEVIANIQGTQSSNIEPKELQKVVEFLKLAQLLGNKSDTLYQQEVQLSNLTDALQTLKNQLQSLQVQQQQTPKTQFVQVLQQVTQQTTTKTEVEVQQPAIGLQQQTSQTKVVTLTLPAEKPAQSEAFVKEIQSIINRSQLSGQVGNMKLFLKLYPENLGQIRIELVQKDGVLTARLLATSAAGKELLENNINQLKAGLVSQNVQVERIDVSQSLQDADRNTRDQSFFNNFFGREQNEDNEQQENDDNEEAVSFKDLLSEEVQ